MAGTNATEVTSGDDRVRLALRRAFNGHEPDLADIRVTEIAAGELLCDVGDEADRAWVVVSGRFQAHAVDADGAERSLSIIAPGELIGEAALLEAGVRTARVRAVRRSQVVEIGQHWLTSQLTEHPGAAMQLIRSLVERSDRAPTAPSGVFAVVPLSTTVVDEARAVAQVAGECVGYGVFDRKAAPIVESSGALDSDWVDEMESRSGGLVLLGHPGDRAWSTAITESADRVLFVVDAEHGADVGELEHEILRSVARAANAARMLLLVHPADADRPRGTRDWLDRRSIDRHLHLRRRSAEHTNRVARHLVGRPVTMAIGAGGVRSAGAVGTVRAFTERGVAIDAAAGVSGGAIIASWLAISDSLDELEDKTDWSMRNLLDYTIPVGAVIAGKRAWSRIQEAVGDRDIADTWLPLVIASTDLTNGRLVNHVTGRMADALYASISIPGVFPPVDIDGALHVDGAVFDAIPVEGARKLVPEGELVVVDLAPPHGRSTDPLPRVMKGGRLLLSKLVPGRRSKSVPNPLDTLMRSTTVASARRRVEALESVDCHIHLNLSEFSVLEFDKVRQVIALAESQSHEPLVEYLESDDPPLTDPLLLEAAANPRPAELPAATETDNFTSASIGATLALAWADLRFRARRFAIAGLASSVVLALLLQMTGVVNQLYREPDVTVGRFGGESWIVPAESDGAFTSNATFTEESVADLPGGRVLLARFRLADADGGNDLDAILVGHEDLPDGAPELDDGRLAEAPGEIVVGTVAEYSVGDVVSFGPGESQVVGTVSEASVFAGMPLVFVPLDVAQELIVGGQPLVSALVVDEVPDLPASLQALDADVVAEDALGPVERPITTLRLVQILLGIVSALIIGAVVFLATLDRLRDIAVMRAMGVGSGIVGLGVAVQSLGIGVVSGLVALVLQALIAPVFPLHIHLELLDRVLLVVIAMVVAGLASYGAIRRTLRIDPAEAFGGPGA